jgi:hypothetical protein
VEEDPARRPIFRVWYWILIALIGGPVLYYNTLLSIFAIFLIIMAFAVFGIGIDWLQNIKISSEKRPFDEKIDSTTVKLLYAVSFVVPLAGCLIGAFYITKEDEHFKHVGKNCLIFGLISIFLIPVTFLVLLIA